MDNASSSELISLYRKRAKWYDWTTLCLYFAGRVSGPGLGITGPDPADSN